MKTGNWFAAITIMGLTAVPALASAHGMGREGAGHEAPFAQCITSMCKVKDARLCRNTLSEAFQKDRADFRRMRAVHAQLKKVMDAQTFNRKSFLALTDRMEQLHVAIMRRHAAAFASVASRLTPEQRRELMKKFSRMSMKMMHHGMMGYHENAEQQQHDWFSHLNE
ncbi:MAG: periplasmic heavy metal sensor [Alphaproteobacteria bacterium]|nr:periplasmic heavy metal sensor [Alphaproteobacteria bacterium]MDE2336987.1 periplasmic heavy metal sensor [Alphaproteobacteria bacterium]